ncbi:MAG TPA: hypothetical protein VFG04_14065 [Planctomycetaceae bacterium]|jgi:hypothetical protein|nr:hypothetical protein [Planctomycetaceae bacterium]
MSTDELTDQEFIEYINTEVRTLLDEIYAVLNEVPLQTTANQSDTAHIPEEVPLSTGDDSSSG